MRPPKRFLNILNILNCLLPKFMHIASVKTPHTNFSSWKELLQGDSTRLNSKTILV